MGSIANQRFRVIDADMDADTGADYAMQSY